MKTPLGNRRQQSKSGDVKGARTGPTSTVAVARSSATASQVTHHCSVANACAELQGCVQESGGLQRFAHVCSMSNPLHEHVNVRWINVGTCRLSVLAEDVLPIRDTRTFGGKVSLLIRRSYSAQASLMASAACRAGLQQRAWDQPGSAPPCRRRTSRPIRARPPEARARSGPRQSRATAQWPTSQSRYMLCHANIQPCMSAFSGTLLELHLACRELLVRIVRAIQFWSFTSRPECLSECWLSVLSFDVMATAARIWRPY